MTTFKMDVSSKFHCTYRGSLGNNDTRLSTENDLSGLMGWTTNLGCM